VFEQLCGIEHCGEMLCSYKYKKNYSKSAKKKPAILLTSGFLGLGRIPFEVRVDAKIVRVSNNQNKSSNLVS